MPRGGKSDERIGRAGAGDAEQIGRLLHDFNAEYEEPTPPVAVLAGRVSELLTAGEIVVLLAGEPAVGIALFRVRPSLWSRAADVHLEELYVVPERRGEGVGRRLLEAAIEAARAAGADHFELTTATSDSAARTLYESAGMTNREGGPEGPAMLYYELDI
jgi:GNAT superfamily N-acetyltransferase